MDVADDIVLVIQPSKLCYLKSGSSERFSRDIGTGPYHLAALLSVPSY